MAAPSPLRDFIRAMTLLVSSGDTSEADLIEHGRALLANLVRRDDWLPDEIGRAHV